MSGEARPPAEEKSEPKDGLRPLIAALLAWLLPGMGHLYLGRRGRAIGFCIIVLISKPIIPRYTAVSSRIAIMARTSPPDTPPSMNGDEIAGIPVRTTRIRNVREPTIFPVAISQGLIAVAKRLSIVFCSFSPVSEAAVNVGAKSATITS